MTQFPQKLKIDQEDLLSDALYFYKDPDFNPRVGLRIYLHGAGTRAVDTEGVLRQFYSDLFVALAENKEMALFQGDPKRRLPLLKSEHVMSGIFEVLGKMIDPSWVFSSATLIVTHKCDRQVSAMNLPAQVDLWVSLHCRRSRPFQARFVRE